MSLNLKTNVGYFLAAALLIGGNIILFKLGKYGIGAYIEFLLMIFGGLYVLYVQKKYIERK